MAQETKIKDVNAVKQKITVVAVIIVIGIVIWQAVGLFGGGTAPSPVPAPHTPPITANNPNNPNNPKNAAQPNAANEANNTATASPQSSDLREAPVMSDPHFLQMQQVTEQKYISKLNDLEELKIQRQIAETNQAIAAAKLATVTAEKSISDLLTKSSDISASAYANRLASPAKQGEMVNVNDTGTSVPNNSPPPVAQASEYTLISVSMQLRKWSAVLGSGGKLYNVSIGDTLPVDGSVVSNINKNSVTLKKDGELRTITITSAI